MANPSGNVTSDEFAYEMDRIQKIVFSSTHKSLDWSSARLASQNLQQEVIALKQQPGNDILIGSPNLIATLTESNSIYEYQICIHPIIAGSGLPLFKKQPQKLLLNYIKTKTFAGGAVIIYYQLDKD